MNTLVIQAMLVAAISLAGLTQSRSPQHAQVSGSRDQPLLESVPPPASGPRAVSLTASEAGRIARATAEVLVQGHYRQAPFDDAMSRTFFTNYLSTLDYSRLVFTQEDVDEFGRRYAESLDNLTQANDASPAYVIFQRYLERLESRTAFALEQLAAPVDFTTDERFNPQRSKGPWPRNEKEAEELWRLRVKFDLLQGRLANDDPQQVVTNLTKRYQRLLKTMKEYDGEEILSLYLTSLANAFDPHSDYMSASEARQFEISNVKLSLTGIGALLEWDDGYTRIRSLVPGGPAERSRQLKPKDRIVLVAQGDGEPVDVVEMRLNKVVELIRGQKGTEVRLTIIPADSEDGARREIRLIRDDIPLTEQFAKARLVDLPGEDGRVTRLGIVILPQFYENCARDVEKLIHRLKEEKVEGLVLDLRRNGGGILEEAIALTGLFIPQGPVVQVKNQNGHTRLLQDDNPKIVWDGPIAIAVGHQSASASEIVAAALQDYGRAVVVGDSATHGKGTVQTLIPLTQFFSQRTVGPYAGKLKFTVSKFYRIAGGTTQKYGVTPDIALPTILDHMELGESYLPNCLPADRTTPLRFQRMDHVDPYLAVLRERSANRVAVSREYAYILEDIEELKRRREDPSVSLNEQVRLAEKEERKTREEARKKERREFDPQPLPIFEVTLDMVARNEPARLLTAAAAKDDEPLLAAASGTEVEDEADKADKAGDEPERLEPQLRETLDILRDYLDLLAAKGQRLVFDGRSATAQK
ncbi:MAG: carboxy terminal-processing peptidase [Verrucomicrobiae bacterium]|nr:carboxy terminal-processing peptidase [Verrucomicrobiae bacterium]